MSRVDAYYEHRGEDGVFVRGGCRVCKGELAAHDDEGGAHRACHYKQALDEERARLVRERDVAARLAEAVRFYADRLEPTGGEDDVKLRAALAAYDAHVKGAGSV